MRSGLYGYFLFFGGIDLSYDGYDDQCAMVHQARMLYRTHVNVAAALAPAAVPRDQVYRGAIAMPHARIC